MRAICLYLLLLIPYNGDLCKGKCYASSATYPPHLFLKVPAIEPDPEPYGDFKTLIVPFKKVGNLIVVEAQIDSVYGNFILDTGAPGLVLNKTYFRDAPHIEDRDAGRRQRRNRPRLLKPAIKHLSIFELNYDRLIGRCVRPVGYREWA
jgi:hypothetical protein